jgi:predicted N-formylglutamate amidohydrolase
MHYVLQVCATASVDDAASVRRAEHMLLPYRDAVALVAARRAEARARRKATVPVHTAPANESTSPATQAATGT